MIFKSQFKCQSNEKAVFFFFLYLSITSNFCSTRQSASESFQQNSICCGIYSFTNCGENTTHSLGACISHDLNQTSKFMFDISFGWSNNESKSVSPLPSIQKQELGLRIWDLSQAFTVLFNEKEKTEGVVTKIN